MSYTPPTLPLNVTWEGTAPYTPPALPLDVTWQAGMDGRHRHRADRCDLRVLQVHAHSSTHQITNTDPAPQFNRWYLSIASPRHSHVNQLFSRRLDFAQAQPKQGLAIHFVFSGPMLVFGQGTDFVAFGQPTIENAAQAAWMQGRVSPEFGNTITSNGFARLRLNLTEPLDASLPIEFSFAPDADRVYAHSLNHTHNADSLSLTHTSPISADAPNHTHSVDALSITHTSPLTLAWYRHTHRAEHITLKHTYPISIDDTQHNLRDYSLGVRLRMVMQSVNTQHSHTAATPSLIHTSPLLGLNSTHRHWTTRISLLPPGWRFTARAAVPFDLRVGMVSGELRQTHLSAQDRRANVAEQSRRAAVSSEGRAVVVPLRVG